MLELIVSVILSKLCQEAKLAAIIQIMPVKIRLMRIGTNKRPFYRVVAVDERKKRTGAYLELLGTYNPLTQPHEIILKEDRIDFWKKNGAVLSDGFLRITKQAPQKPPRKPKKEKAEKPAEQPAAEVTQQPQEAEEAALVEEPATEPVAGETVAEAETTEDSTK